jgi:ribosomal-protein-alanine N-acetyltransferase
MTMTPGTVRAALVEDADALARLHALSFAQGWSAQELRVWLERADAPGWVCVVRAARVGFILVQDLGDAGDILTLAVDPDWRRKGVGQALVRAAMAGLRARGAQRLLLDVREDNDGAVALYSRLGFQRDGVRKGYYRQPDGGPCDAVLMSLELE